MIKTFISAAVLLSLPVAAFAGERTFKRDGVTYTYTSKRDGDVTVLEGKAFPGGSSYTLTVRGKQVTGRVGGTPVSFRIAKPLAPTVQTASR
ncbi:MULTISPECIES: hypothetical protein [unclassified Sphingomonas]|uniref:hypothetical protein n=1 Tax=unclassified Sphingomonas TaxID=196159 RepID=UPI002151E27B|nr:MULTISPECIES: hypothetical protein [unclassified Sphingomonas]MCR5871728.1 hypothetical protein [Sphingomonas sp. J344]UUX99983.1 hypothetical protein LRS08_02230 [Sphingomonas sp. J315]